MLSLFEAGIVVSQVPVEFPNNRMLLQSGVDVGSGPNKIVTPVVRTRLQLSSEVLARARSALPQQCFVVVVVQTPTFGLAEPSLACSCTGLLSLSLEAKKVFAVRRYLTMQG